MGEPRRLPRLGIRLLACVGVALAVGGTAYLCAWYNLRDWPYFTDDHYHTAGHLDALRDGIERHRAASGKLPKSLGELEEVRSGRVLADAEGRVVDIWGNPYQYQVSNRDYSLFSFGQDGQPGGNGLNADLYPRSGKPPNYRPTFWQFTTELPIGGVQLSCALAGMFAGLVYLTSRRRAEGGRPRTRFIFGAVVTVAAAVVMAVFMSALHLPTGH